MNHHDDRPEEKFADVGAQRIARVYAEALYDAAAKRNEVDATLEQLDSLINDVGRANPLVVAFFGSPAVPTKVKAAEIQKLFDGRATELFTNFLLVLNEHGRLDLLRPVLAAYRDLHDQRARRVRVHVRSAVPLPEDQQERLRQGVRNALHLEPILEARVEPDLLGGLIVKVGDWQYDGSVRTRLQTIRQYLIERSSHEIQSGRDRFSSDS